MVKIEAIGHIGRDCEVREVSGQYAIGFSIAHSTSYTNQEGVKIDKTTWLSCTLWRSKSQSIRISEYLKKGQLVYLEGMPQADWYQNREGEIMSQLRVRVNNIQLLGGAVKQEQKEQKSVDYEQLPDGEDDLPF